MPLLRPALVRRLLDLAAGHDACVPVVDGFPVPTCAVYRSEHAATAQALVAQGGLGPRALLDRIDTRYVEAGELREADPDLASFLDCNTPERYAAALRDAGLEVPPWVGP
jgi:molybdopterin-guanine dinucleotide biosynthesis protein A